MRYLLSDISNICRGKLVGVDLTAESVFTDSRSFSLGQNPLFVAISGANHDGHNFIKDLYYRGVRSFIVERELEYSLYPQASFVVVKNSIKALQTLAGHYREQFKGMVVGITGSNGKSVVKEWISQLCPAEIKIFRSPKSYNSQIGVPLSILMIEGDEEVAVIEAGISKMDEMSLLEKIIRPNIGIITTIGDAHQENFESIEQKLEQKLELFKHAETIIYNSSYHEIKKLINERFGEINLVDTTLCQEFTKLFSDQASQQNVATAVTFFKVLGYQISSKSIKNLQPVAMRLELKEGINGSIIVNDSYNSDINSLAIALDYLKSISGGRKQTLILSDILQSGLSDNDLYSRVATMTAASGIDHLIGIGDRIRTTSEHFACRTDFYPTTESFLAAVNRDDVAERAILIKGNRISGFERVSHALQLRSHTTTLEVNLDAMVHNLNIYRASLAPKTRLMVMVKASGYGNGSYEIANMLQNQGVNYLAVAFADEGVTLRERGIVMPIVVLNADEDSFELMISNSLEPEIYNFSSLNAFVSILNRHSERDYPIHIKLDTGMHRLGFEAPDIDELNDILAQNTSLIKVKSIFAHLAASEDPAQDDFTHSQIELFDRLSTQIASLLSYSVIRHTANSAAIERFPEAQFDMCRLGIGLYGVGATPEVELKHVSTLRSRIVQIKNIAPDQTVGYGRAGKLSRQTRIATVPMGYADGLNRRLSCGNWAMIIGGKPAPIVGRICMDTCMVDITDIDAAEGDDVTIFGNNKGYTIDDMARVLGTITYEIMTSISARVKRIYIKE